jgi:hypothetical protein
MDIHNWNDSITMKDVHHYPNSPYSLREQDRMRADSGPAYPHPRPLPQGEGDNLQLIERFYPVGISHG